MSEVKFGFIGTGNMGSAIARAVRKSLPGHEILLSDKNEGKAQTNSAAAQPTQKPWRERRNMWF